MHGLELWVDLEQVLFIDSTGLGMLVGVLKEAGETNGCIHLMNVSREVRRILQVTGVASLFEKARAGTGHNAILDDTEGPEARHA